MGTSSWGAEWEPEECRSRVPGVALDGGCLGWLHIASRCYCHVHVVTQCYCCYCCCYYCCHRPAGAAAGSVPKYVQIIKEVSGGGWGGVAV